MEKLKGCPICESKESSTFLKCVDYTVSRETFTIQECGGCNFRFTSPRPSENEISPYYKSEAYISHTDSGKGVINSIYKQIRKYTLAQKFRLIKGLSEGNSILDYGSGAGVFLKYCKERNWRTKGVEADQETRERVSNGLELDVISPEEIGSLGKEQYDVITLWHVLEHVHQLKKTIQSIESSLKPNGVILVAVPNCSSNDAVHYGAHWAAYDVPRHIYHFRPSDISKLFEEFGIYVADILPMVFDSYYVSLLSEKHKSGSIKFLSGMWRGLISNINAEPNKTYSSQIYVLRKNKAI